MKNPPLGRIFLLALVARMAAAGAIATRVLLGLAFAFIHGLAAFFAFIHIFVELLLLNSRLGKLPTRLDPRQSP